MKKMYQVLISLSLVAGAALPVFAQTAAREDNSMLLTYLFLGTCALIILLQMVPVFAMVFGIVRGLFSKKADEVKPAPVKIR